jgi:hypothetical protein
MFFISKKQLEKWAEQKLTKQEENHFSEKSVKIDIFSVRS